MEKLTLHKIQSRLLSDLLWLRICIRTAGSYHVSTNKAARMQRRRAVISSLRDATLVFLAGNVGAPWIPDGRLGKHSRGKFRNFAKWSVKCFYTSVDFKFLRYRSVETFLQNIRKTSIKFFSVSLDAIFSAFNKLLKVF